MFALATDLIGFAGSTLRVHVDRREGDYAWITTADLLDVGTKLVLDAAQIRPLDEPQTDLRHMTGLVNFTR